MRLDIPVEPKKGPDKNPDQSNREVHTYNPDMRGIAFKLYSVFHIFAKLVNFNLTYRG
jgi:hypothetical protein